jgi:hypothetical protein
MLGTAAGVGLVLATACSQSFCPVGVLPFDGATGVSVDTDIVFTLDRSLDPDTPGLEDAIGLFDLTSGEAVAFDVEVDFETGLVVVLPQRPLTPEHEFQLSGLDEQALRDAEPHWRGWLPLDLSITRFSTASAPAALHAWLLESNTAVIAFSEAMDLDTLQVKVDAAYGRADATVLGPFEGEERLVEVLLPAEISPRTASTFWISGEATSLLGTALQEAPANVTGRPTTTTTEAPPGSSSDEAGPLAQDAVPVPVDSFGPPLDRFRGLPTCW